MAARRCLPHQALVRLDRKELAVNVEEVVRITFILHKSFTSSPACLILVVINNQKIRQ
jgi:hypothetical protein